MITEERLAHIEEWIGTPEDFLMARIFGEDSRREREQLISQALKELIAEVRALQLENNGLKYEANRHLFEV